MVNTLCYEKLEKEWEMKTEQETGVKGFGDKKHEPPLPAYILHMKLISNTLMQCQDGNGKENQVGNKTRNGSPSQASVSTFTIDTTALEHFQSPNFGHYDNDYLMALGRFLIMCVAAGYVA